MVEDFDLRPIYLDCWQHKVLESNVVAPPTSMAAHAVDDCVDQIEAEDKFEAIDTSAAAENGLPFRLPPLPSLSKNNYIQVCLF